MNGSPLSIGMYGGEVKLFHEKLRKSGFEIPASEIDRQFFGPATRQALQQYQQEHGLPITGTLDERTAESIDGAGTRSDIHPTPLSSENTNAEVGSPVVFSAPLPLPGAPPSTPNSPVTVGPPPAPLATTDVIGEAASMARGAIAVNTNLNGPQTLTPARSFGMAGRTIDRRTHGGVAGLRVEAWDKELICQDLVSDAMTGPGGAFEMSLSETYLRQLFQDRQPALFFRVFKGNQLVASTETSALWYVRAPETEFRIEVDLQLTGRLEAPAALVVRGQVLHAVNGPLAGQTVKAFDKNLGVPDKLLGSAVTDATGNYVIQFTPALLGRAGKSRADLFVKVFSPGGNPPLPPPALIATSSIFPRALPTTTIDLVVGGPVFKGPSDHEMLMALVQPALNGTALTSLGSDDLAFVAQTTEVGASRLAPLVAAARLAGETHLPPEVFYALARAGLPTDRRVLLSRDPQVLRRALQAGIDNNIIPGRLAPMIDSLTAQLQQATVQLAFEPPNPSTTTTLSAILDPVISTKSAASGAPSLQQQFLSEYVQHQGSIEQFWQKLATNTAFQAPGLIDKIQFTLQMAALTRHHLPLIRVLQNRRANGQVTSLRDLAKLDEADWLALINQPEVSTPADVPGADAAEKANNYAAVLSRTIETAFSTAALAHRIGKHATLSNPDLSQFFANNQDFDFSSQRVETYLAANSNSFAGVSDPATLRLRLKGIERLFKLTPRVSEIQALMEDGLHSAHGVMRLGKGALQKRYGKKLGPDRVDALHDSACRIVAGSQALGVKYHSSFNSVGAYGLPAIAPSVTQPGPQVADWKTLFGSVDFCACEHCRSIYSPAAYLVDLLQFLDQHESKEVALGPRIVTSIFTNAPALVSIQFKSAKEVLLERRPDIAHIELSCENTEIPLPYVDLVSEILAYAIANSLLNPSAAFPDHIATAGTAEELSANPQPLPSSQVYNTAYDTLANSVYPIELPFDLWQQEARVYLGHLGTPRWQLIETFRRGTPPDAGDLEFVIAAEQLGLTQLDRHIITGQTQHQPWEFWGLDAEGTQGGQAIADPTGGPDPIQGQDWVAVLSHVAVFLHRSGLNYADLQELLAAAFINPTQKLHVASSDNNDPLTCDVSKVVIAALDDSALDRIQRFLRLLRALGWTIAELDKAFTALKPPAAGPDDPFILKLARIERLRTGRRIPVVEILSWWAPIDTQAGPASNEKSLYERVFLNKSVMNPVDDKFVVAAVTDPNTTELVSAHAAAVLAALKIRASDLSLLIDGTTRLTLGTLSQLYRTVSLSRALGLKTADLLALQALSGIDPFDAGDLGQAVKFVDTLQRVRDSRFKIEELDYLLRHVVKDTSRIAPSTAAIDLLLDEIQNGLGKIVAETTVTRDASGAAVDETGEITTKNISLVLPPDQVQSGLMLIDGTSTSSDAAKSAFIDQYFQAFLDPVDAKAKLIGLGALKTKGERFAYVVPRLLGYLRRLQSESLILQKLAESLKLEAATAELLLTDVISAQVDHTLKAIADFMPQSDAEYLAYLSLTNDQRRAADALRRERQRATCARLNKAGMVINRLKINSEEVGWLAHHNTQPGWLDFNELPLDLASSGQPLFDACLRLVDLIHLRDSLPAGTTALFELFRIAATRKDDDGKPVDSLEELSKRSGWALDDLQQLAGPQGWFSATFSGLALDQQLARLALCFALLKRLGLSAPQVLPWTAAQLTPDDARALATGTKNAVKAKYDQDQWETIAKPLHDVLREKQRAALVSYLVWQHNLVDSNRLFAEYLVDVEMDPCQMTSRIKQAIGSVQLFVQRCFLNLEKMVTLDEEAAKQWKWMKNYRVWEANRKVFCYPENWIEPDLRDDKTPFFKALENEILQNDITAASAEDAVLHYLEKLDRVARLEIAGMYHQAAESKDDHDVLHVFGRTFGDPHVYFYRRRVDESYWTPWEQVDLDIKGDHLLPVVWNRRLHLFWPIIAEVADEDQSGNNSSPDRAGSPATKHLEIQLAWSEYKNGRWLAKKVTTDPVVRTDWASSAWQRSHLSLEPVGPGTTSGFEGDLTIRLVYDFNFKDTFKDTLKDTLRGTFLAEYTIGGTFQFTGCGGNELTTTNSEKYVSYYGRIPRGTDFDQMDLVGSADNSLFLLTGSSAFLDRSGVSDADFQNMWSDIFKKAEDTPILQHTRGTFRLIFPHQYKHFVTQDSLFYQDDRGPFVVSPRTDLASQWSNSSRVYIDVSATIGDGTESNFQPVRDWLSAASGLSYFPSYAYSLSSRYCFETFYHSYVCDFMRQINRFGVAGLLDWSKQKPPLQLASRTFFDVEYAPVDDAVKRPYPMEEVDFSHRGAYSQYNWEIFFHAPLLIADRLSKNQRFEEAQEWFHYIFDPTTGSTDTIPRRFWKVRPFYENTNLQSIQDLMQPKTKPFEVLKAILFADNEDDATQDLAAQIEQWRQHPFNPHLIARMRPVAYQKNVVMKYIDNLIAWGDQLFKRDTIESINEATQLYILAAEVLGPHPAEIPPRGQVGAMTYQELEPKLDDFSNAMVEMEHWVPRFQRTCGCGDDAEHLVVPTMLYFCVPTNDQLLGYWDTVADRLFKIRHCMNIEGVVRQLPLFEPPIDPALLVRATAAGVDLSSVLNDLYAPAPHYRFTVMLQKANELCAEVKALGSALLGALEKRDAEGLTLLRSTHEIAVLEAVQQIKEKQIDEAQSTLDGLGKTREMASARQKYYSSRPFMNVAELAHASLSLQAAGAQAIVEGVMSGASSSHNAPTQVSGGAGMASAVAVSTTVDGTKIGNSAEAAAKAMSITVLLMREAAAQMATLGGYLHRADDWAHLAEQAAIEVEQVQKQIDAASLRLAIARKELDNHNMQTDNARAVDDYMRGKFSNQELYDWMVAQIAAVYFQSYQMAYDVAKRAEKAFQFERGLTSSSLIQFGYWDSLKKGLLAGERLSLDLKRMEMAYLDLNKREYEITKHISIMLNDPMALITLKETGQCEILLSEDLFDADYPGHYMRRIKSVSLTMPCVVGPYTSMNCTLTLLNNKTRIKTVPSDPYDQSQDGNDDRFVTNFAAMESIATSHAQNDSGLFELNFRDERYLPFEGAGVISRWRIELPKESNAFDLDTLSDVVLHLRYTARDGGEILKDRARTALSQRLQGDNGAVLTRLFSLKHEFPTKWYRFLHPIGDPSSIELDLTQERFPFQLRGKKIEISELSLFLKPKGDVNNPLLKINLGQKDISDLDNPQGSVTPLTQAGGVQFDSTGSPIAGLPFCPPQNVSLPAPSVLTISAAKNQIDSLAQNNKIDDIWLVCRYLVA